MIACYSGAGQDLRPCWVWEEVPVPDVGVIRNGDGLVVAVWERRPDGGAECLYRAQPLDCREPDE